MIELGENEVREIRLSILKSVCDVCVRRDLKVYPVFSTLLGAVRHEDFVPWLIGAEICLPRPHYDELLTCFDEEAKAMGLKYRVVRPFTQDAPSLVAHIEDVDTAIVESGDPPRGVGVSVYPIDGLGDDPDNARKIARKVNYLCLAYKLKTGDKEAVLREKSALERLKIRMLARLNKISRIEAAIEASCRERSFADSKYLGVIVSAHGEKTVFERGVYESGEKRNFSSAQVEVMAGYDEFLTAVYGEYMLFPPTEERGNRAFKAYKKDEKIQEKL